MGTIDEYVRHFNDLSARFAHAPRRGCDRPLYELAQRELWQLAQAICHMSAPKLQHELDLARRDVVAQIRLHIENVGPVVVRPAARDRPRSWAEYHITPEISYDPSTNGATITTDVARRLLRAHKAQVHHVFGVVNKRS